MLAIAAALLASACTSRALPPRTSAAIPGHCVAGTESRLLGLSFDAPHRAEAMRVTGATNLRVARPDEVVTTDYRDNRLTVFLDARGRVASAHCG